MDTVTFDPKVGIALTHAVPHAIRLMSLCRIPGPDPAVKRVEIMKHPVTTTTTPQDTWDVNVHFGNSIRVMVIFDGDRAVSLVPYHHDLQAGELVSLR